MRKGLTLLSVLFTVSLLLAWAPEPETGAFTLPENQWTKIAESPADPLGRELEPGMGAYFCFVPDSGKFLRYGGYTPTEGNELYTFDAAKREWKNPLPVDYNWPPPANRPGAGPWWSMAYDGSRKCVWVYAGSGVARQTHTSLYNDIWKYDIATGSFTKMNSLGWYVGSQVRIAYDPVNDVVVRAPADGSYWDVRLNLNATWVYNPDSNKWSSKATTGSPRNALAAGWLFCPPISKFIYIGFNAADTPQTVLTWTYDAAANKWDTLITTGKPPARICPAITYDPNTGRVIMYGGVGHRPTGYSYLYRGGGVQLEDTWVLDPVNRTWTDISSIVGKPKIADLKKNDGSPLLPMTLTMQGRFLLTQGADYDTRNNLFVFSAPTCGVWALRYNPSGTPMAALNLPVLPSPPPIADLSPIFPRFPLNSRLTNITPNKWLKLGGGRPIGGDEIPFKYDPTSGYFLKYGGCGNGGTTFASGYGNDLSAYDPFNERWIALRYVDPCGPARPSNGCTRFYAGDAANQCVWFTGGTSGNYLPASIPQTWTGTYGTWRYQSNLDRFDMVRHAGTQPLSGSGVCSGYDPVNHIFMGMPCCYSPINSILNTSTLTWATGPNKTFPAGGTYTYADYVDSLGLLAVIDQNKLRGYNAATGTWSVIDTLPDTTNVRPSVAYDPVRNVILAHIQSGKTWIFKVAAKTWVNVPLDTVMPSLGEHVAYDDRHGVFIGGSKGGLSMWAFRYSEGASVQASPELPVTLSIASVSPNPFKGGVSALCAIPEAGAMRLSVYATDGTRVRTLTDGIRPRGTHRVEWNGRDDRMSTVSAGFYVLKLESGNRSAVRTVMLLR